MANKNEKGLNRGGIGGQEGELGEESKNLDANRSMGGQQDRPGQPRPGQQQPQQRPGQQQPPQQRPGQQPRPDQPQRQGQERPGQQQPQRGGTPGGMSDQQRGGLRREPNLEGAEKDTEHEVD
jgi:hypothetical protein